MTSKDQRRLTRLTLSDTSVGVIDIESGVEFAGEGRNLSTEGLSFLADMEPSIGADMQVVLRAKDPRLAPLRATLKVLRVTRAGEGKWDVSGTLRTSAMR